MIYPPKGQHIIYRTASLSRPTSWMTAAWLVYWYLWNYTTEYRNNSMVCFDALRHFCKVRWKNEAVVEKSHTHSQFKVDSYRELVWNILGVVVPVGLNMVKVLLKQMVADSWMSCCCQKASAYSPEEAFRDLSDLCSVRRSYAERVSCLPK